MRNVNLATIVSLNYLVWSGNRLSFSASAAVAFRKRLVRKGNAREFFIGYGGFPFRVCLPEMLTSVGARRNQGAMPLLAPIAQNI